MQDYRNLSRLFERNDNSQHIDHFEWAEFQLEDEQGIRLLSPLPMSMLQDPAKEMEWKELKWIYGHQYIQILLTLQFRSSRDQPFPTY